MDVGAAGVGMYEQENGQHERESVDRIRGIDPGNAVVGEQVDGQ